MLNEVIWRVSSAPSCGRATDVLPVERQAEPAQSFVVARAAKQVCQHRRLVAGRVHRGKTGDRHRVEPREDVCGEELVRHHGGERIPEPPQRLRVLQVLPVQPLERLDGRQGGPVDRVDLPDGDGPQNSAQSISKKAYGDRREDDGGGGEREVVKELLGGKDLRACRRVRGGCGRDGCDSVLFERPWAGIDEY